MPLKAIDPPQAITVVSLDHEVVVLPIREEDDSGIYSGAVSELVKSLKAEGVDAGFLHDTEHRQWEVLMGDVPLQLVVGFASGLASAATWDLIKATFGRLLDRDRRVRARILREHTDRRGRTHRNWFEFDGDRDAFLEALDHLDAQANDK